MNSKDWIGVDLDGTLAHYDGWRGVEHVGNPVQRMVARVETWLARGIDVRIFTARISGEDSHLAIAAIEAWCFKHIGVVLPITNIKDFGMIEYWDDRAVQVITNTGLRADDGNHPRHTFAR